ncbi:hypothetical protein AXX17_AT2G19440 [Arabidopsis thaliana]|uniref:Uncharacterized protein n=1 Tax=Arabidopsis thaliana TaxID=3702 RepID=A0A178VQ93_ARATH|nr:hypothetical protein AXX17_AT2G19440 [Arabidopsis thaliana]
MFEEMHMPKETTILEIHDPKENKSWDVMYKLIKPTEMLLTVSIMGLHDYPLEVISDDDVCEVISA